MKKWIVVFEIYLFGFLWHINQCRLFNAKSIFVEENCENIRPIVFKEVYTFSLCTISKVNVLARVEFELAYFETAVLHL